MTITRNKSKDEWHWLCRLFGHKYVLGWMAQEYAVRCTRCRFDPGYDASKSGDNF